MLGGANINKAALPSTDMGDSLCIGIVLTFTLFWLTLSRVVSKISPDLPVTASKPNDWRTRSNPCLPAGLPKSSANIGDPNCKV